MSTFFGMGTVKTPTATANAACELERTLDLVEESLDILGVKYDPRAKGAELMRGKYADNKPREISVS